MSTLQKRDSENQVPINVETGATPELKKSKSDKAAGGVLPSSNLASSVSAVERTTELIAAWGAGRFNADDADAQLAAFKEFHTEDVVMDASAAAHSGVPAYKVHNGFAGLKEWFDFLASFSFEAIEMSFVAGPAPNEIWARFSSSMATWKPTGKGTPFSCVTVYTWEGDKLKKMTLLPHNPAAIAAICSEQDVPIPSTVQLPAFEPNPNPLEPFAEKMALWGAGELLKEEVRREHIAADAVDDQTDSALPDVLKPYRGIDGIGESVEYADKTWEISNVDAVPIVGLKPGCVHVRITMDIKHKTTGKEAKGLQKYSEFAYGADGKFVYARHFYVNAPLLASIN